MLYLQMHASMSVISLANYHLIQVESHHSMNVLSAVIRNKMVKRKKTDLETAKESLLLKVHTLGMAIRERNTVNAIQAVNEHVQTAIGMLEALKEDSDKILPVKRRSPRMQTL